MSGLARNIRSLSARAASLSLVAVLVFSFAAHAAELVAAELDGQVNRITVEQGRTTTFTIQVKATGSIRCTTTPENPATARFDTVFAISELGAVTSSTLSAPLPFYAGPEAWGTCDVTWPGDPAWMSVTANVTVSKDAPLGDRVIQLRPLMYTPPGSGDTLRDDTKTLVTFTVVPGSDVTPPEVVCDGPNGVAGDNGWYTTPVAYACESQDLGSGLLNPDDASFELVTDGEGAVETDERVVMDTAGNGTPAGPYGLFDVDLHDPSVTVHHPADGAVFILGEEAYADFSCADTADGSGLQSCEGTIADGGALDTSTVGTKAMMVTAIDNAGRWTAVELTYDVVYDYVAPSAPGKSPYFSARAGSVIALRWSLNGVSSLDSLVWARSKEAACDAAPSDDATEPMETTGGTGLTYNASTDEFTFMWKTDKAWAGTCRQVQLRFDDGTTRTMNFQFS